MMASTLRVLAVTLAALVFLPSTSAQTGTWTFNFATPSTLIITVEAAFEGDAASQIRNEIDAQGNGDGTVAESEVNNFEVAAISFINAYGPMALSGAGFLVDQKDPTELVVKVLDIQDAAGPADAETPVGLRAVADLSFPVKPGARHVLTVEPSRSSAGYFEANVEDARLAAPRNYVIESTSALPPGASVSADKKSIQFAGSFQTADTMTVTLARSGGTSPSTAFLGILIAIGVGVAATRRRPFA